MGLGEPGRGVDPPVDLLVHRLRRLGLSRVSKFGVDQDVSHRLQELGLLKREASQQGVDDSLLSQEPSVVADVSPSGRHSISPRQGLARL